MSVIFTSEVKGRQESTVSLANIDLIKERHNFVVDHYVMVLLISGRGVYIDEVTGEKFKLQDGDIYQRFPGRSHAQVFETINNKQFFLRVPKELYYLMAERGQLNNKPVLTIGNKPLFSAFQQCYLDCTKENDAAYALWRVKDLIVQLHDWSFESQTVSIMDQALTHMEKMIQKRSTLDELASRFNMSTISFRRHFKRHTGISPGAWMIQRRISKAAQMLTPGLFSIEDVSHYLGYPDVYSFSKQFKKEKGMSPAEFRKSANF